MSYALNRKSVVPTPEEIELAKKSTKKIAALTAGPSGHATYLLSDSRGAAVEVSESAFKVLVETLKEMAEGKAVMLMPVDAELTTQQAADLLNVSRPYLVNLLESKEIPFRHVGRYRRVRYQDILDYQQKLQEKSKAAMDELVAQAQELGMGY